MYHPLKLNSLLQTHVDILSSWICHLSTQVHEPPLTLMWPNIKHTPRSHTVILNLSPVTTCTTSQTKVLVTHTGRRRLNVHLSLHTLSCTQMLAYRRPESLTRPKTCSIPKTEPLVTHAGRHAVGRHYTFALSVTVNSITGSWKRQENQSLKDYMYMNKCTL